MAVTFHVNSNNINGTIIQTDKKAGAGSKKTIHANGLNHGSDLDARIAFRKKCAQKQAFKIIGDAWDKDKKADEKLANKVTKKENNQQDISDLKDKIKYIVLSKSFSMLYKSSEIVVFIYTYVISWKQISK